MNESLADKLRRHFRNKLIKNNGMSEKEVKKVIDAVNGYINKPYDKDVGWEQYIPKYLMDMWSDLSEDVRMVLYIMACGQLMEHVEGDEEYMELDQEGSTGVH